jgi:hypothetical protein
MLAVELPTERSLEFIEELLRLPLGHARRLVEAGEQLLYLPCGSW